jgi:hypothetical protein
VWVDVRVRVRWWVGVPAHMRVRVCVRKPAYTDKQAFHWQQLVSIFLLAESSESVPSTYIYIFIYLFAR